MGARFEGTGLVVPVPDGKIGNQPVPVPGEHLWIVAGAWKVDPVAVQLGEQVSLDSENLVSISPPGCFWCEKKFEMRLLHRPCPGERR